MKQCIFPQCTGNRYSRGLCLSHYSIARNLIRNKKTTWATLEANGKSIAPGKKGATGAQEWFLAAPEPPPQNP